jgi:hypothetical protein
MVYKTILRPRGQVSADLTLEGFVPAHTHTYTHTHTVREQKGRLDHMKADSANARA